MIPREQYKRAKRLVAEADNLLHAPEGARSDELLCIVEQAHGLIHDIAHAIVERGDPDHAALQAAIANPVAGDEAADLFQSERISAAQAVYDEAMEDFDETEPEHEVRAFDAMKAAIARADQIAATGRV